MSRASEPSREHLHKVGRGGSQNLVAAIVAAAVGILTSILLARLLTAENLGVFFSATSLVILAAAVARLGTSVSLVYWVSRLRELGHSGQLTPLLRIALGPVTLLSVLLAVGMFTTAPLFSDWLFEGTESGTTLIRVLAVFTPFIVLFDALLGATRGFGAMTPTAVIDRLGRPILQMTLIVFAGLTAGLVAVGIGWAVPYLFATVAAALWLRKLVARHQTQTSGTTPNLRQAFWHYTWPRAVSSVVQQARQRLDLVLVAALSSPVETAIYGVASRFLVVGQLTNSAIGLAAQPQVASLNAAEQHDAVKGVYRTTTTWIILVNGPLYLILAIFSPLLLRLFNPEYSSAWPITVVLCAAAYIGNGSGMVDVMLSMTGRTRWTLANSLGALALQVGLDIVLIPSAGAMGAAIGWAVSIIAINAMSVAQLAWSDGIHPFGAETWSAVAVTLVAVALPATVCMLLLGQSWLAFFVAVAVAGVVYLLLLRRFSTTFHLDLLLASLRRGRA